MPCLVAALAMLAVVMGPRPAPAYIEVAFTLGKIVNDSTNIVLMQVESVDKTKNTITYRKVEDIKGKHPQDIIKHNIAQAGFHPREWQTIMAWAEVGQLAVFCHNGSASETCINNYWYQAYPGGEWWNFFHAEPYLLRTFAGKPERLAPLIKQMLAGQEVVVTAMVDGDKNALQLRTARVQRLKASLKIQDYDQKRDFVGWGGEELRPIAGMPGFTHLATLTRTSPGAAGSLAFDFDADGKTDFVVWGETKASLYTSDGSSTNEILLPFAGGARGAAAGALGNGTLPDIVLATPEGPKLITNLGGGKIRDDSAAFAARPYVHTTAVALGDFSGTGRNDVVLADGFSGLRLYRNVTPKDAAKDAVPKLEDVSDAVGLGAAGVAGGVKAESLLVADVNGDSRPDILVVADTPVLILNTPAGFVAARDSGLAFRGGKVAPAFGRIGKDLYLAVPQPGATHSRLSLYVCDNKGKFAEVTSGPLASFPGQATCVTFADFDNSGHVDLLVGVLRAPNRFFRHVGGSAVFFEDASEALGLTQKIFNTRGITVLDLNRDRAPDLLLNNEAQDPVILLANPRRLSNGTKP